MSSEQDTADESWSQVRETVLERDDHQCQFCGISDEAHREEFGRGIEAHHIIPEKDGGPDEPENLIAVCRSCHRTLEKAHGRAMAQMLNTEACNQEIQKLVDIETRRHEKQKTITNRICEHLAKNPTFRERLDWSGITKGDTYPPTPHNWVRKGTFLSEEHSTIGSEWALVYAAGYAEGQFAATEESAAIIHDLAKKHPDIDADQLWGGIETDE